MGACRAAGSLEMRDVAPDEKPTGMGPPNLTPPEVTSDAGPSDAGPKDAGGGDAADAQVGSDRDAAISDATVAPEAMTPVDRVENTPTVAGFGTLGEPRHNASAAWLYDDGFELGERSCNAAGYCAIASFAP
jgi:hypothetical protein